MAWPAVLRILALLVTTCLTADPQDGASALRERLEEVRGLIHDRAGDVNPQVLERVRQLEVQVEALEQAAAQTGPIGRIPACFAMALERAGGTKDLEVEHALRALADSLLPVYEAASIHLFRMIAVCASNITDEELDAFRSGSLSELPQVYEQLSQEAEAKTRVQELYAEDWDMLSFGAQRVLRRLPQQRSSQPPAYMLFFVAVPIANLISYLWARHSRAGAAKEQTGTSDTKPAKNKEVQEGHGGKRPRSGSVTGTSMAEVVCASALLLSIHGDRLNPLPDDQLLCALGAVRAECVHASAQRLASKVTQP